MYGTMPQPLVEEIREAYKGLEAEYGEDTETFNALVQSAALDASE